MSSSQGPFATVACVLLALSFACERPPREVRGDVADLARMLRRASPRPAEQKLSGELRDRLAASLPDQRLRVLVDLVDQLDLDEVSARLGERGASRAERRRLVVDALEAVARRGQSALRPQLEQLRGRGDIESYQGFVIVNRVAVVATPRGVRALAGRAEVAAIVGETEKDLTEESMPSTTSAPRRVSWAISALGVDAAWQRGLDGRGVVVGIIDPGASAVHEQLRGNFRGGDRSWHDPTGRHAAPRDVAPGHGTGVLSVAVGQNVSGVIIGAAPAARWIACAGLPRRRVNNVLVTACADWMLTVGQPDVLVAPWLLPVDGCDTSLHRIVSAWRAAEILPVFAAGNHGPEARTDRSPANYVGLAPGAGTALAVGGTGRGGGVYRLGSRGPGACGGKIYPVIVAPAVDLPAALPLTVSSYVQAGGTSLAAGYAAGAAALLLQRFPEAGVADLEAALVAGVIDDGPPGPDDTFGYGRLYVPAALTELERRLARRPAREAKARSTAENVIHR